jgi:hypothetical protein
LDIVFRIRDAQFPSEQQSHRQKKQQQSSATNPQQHAEETNALPVLVGWPKVVFCAICDAVLKTIALIILGCSVGVFLFFIFLRALKYRTNLVEIETDGLEWISAIDALSGAIIF